MRNIFVTMGTRTNQETAVQKKSVNPLLPQGHATHTFLLLSCLTQHNTTIQISNHTLLEMILLKR